jgi:phosphoribosylanthranilate isomerase
MFIKICGIRRVADALHAVEQGATALGFVFWPNSPRYISPDRAALIIAELPADVTTVGVFVNADPAAMQKTVEASGVSAVQLHGDEPVSYAGALTVPPFRSVTLGNAADVCPLWPAGTTFLLDAADPARRGGTGVPVDWTRAAALARQWPLVLAGGLNADNVSEAIALVRPVGVDVSSGVEQGPGEKDPARVARFVAQARRAFEEATGARGQGAGGRESSDS